MRLTIVSRRILPCGCSLSWDADEAVVALCLRHSVEYLAWKAERRRAAMVAEEVKIENSDPESWGEEMEAFVNSMEDEALGSSL